MEEKQQGINVIQQRSLNSIEYSMLPSTSVAVSRVLERQFWQKSRYDPQTEALCDMNTGAKFVNAKRSYLTFSVQLKRTNDDGGGLANIPVGGFGKGSVCNLIRRVVVTTRSGVELCRTEDMNILSAKTLRYGCSREYLEQFGELMGYSPSLASTTDEFSDGTGSSIGATSLSNKRQFIIPLDILSPVFKGDGKTLLPPQLAAGLRVQITFESAARALLQDAASTAPTSYVIDDISIMANTTTLVDAWQKALNEESASEGLTYSFATWYSTTSTLPSATDRINIEQRKAVARALKAFCVYTVGADSVATDNMASEPYTFDRVEWRLGSLYPYHQPVTNAAEAYYGAQNSFDGGVLDCRAGINAVSFNAFKGKESIAAVTLERSDIKINGLLNISGLSTNNSRVLSVDLKLATPAAESGRIYCFMEHVSMCKAFLDNASLSI